jgi:hypothetical protein
MNRRRFLVFEPLEVRYALSGVGITDAAMLSEAEAEPTTALPTLGVIGDSLSDEYSQQTYDYARNWLELLVQENKVSVGDYGNWGEPRRAGYQLNWSRYGATSGSILSEGQAAGLAGHIDGGEIDYSVLAVGANDFHPLGAAYHGIYFGNWSPSRISEYVDTVAANLRMGFETIWSDNVHSLIVNAVDFNDAVSTRRFFTDADRREHVTKAVAMLNNELGELAREYQVPILDAFALSKDFLGQNHAPIASQLVGGVTITNTAGVSATSAFVADGAHPHTVLQSAVANGVLSAFNVIWGAEFEPFSEEEMVSLAGLEYGGQDTLNWDFASYVLLPGAWQNAAVAADIDADGVVTPIDVVAVVNELNTPRYHDDNGRLPLRRPEGQRVPFYDVNGDGYCTPLDPLAIINFIHAGGEGEAIAMSATMDSVAGLHANESGVQVPGVEATSSGAESLEGFAGSAAETERPSTIRAHRDWPPADEEGSEFAELLDVLVPHQLRIV